MTTTDATQEAAARRISARVEEMASPDFRYPTHAELAGSDCDLVMKGGITSGIVYPLAACELARQYRFRSLGGSSAGAIGAVLVAAAEHARDRGGFQRLAEIPSKLGPRLGDLFTAGPSTQTALAVLKGWLQPDRPMGQRVGDVLRTLVGAQRRPFVIGLLGVLVIGIAGALVAAGLPQDAGDWIRVAIVTVLLTLPVALGVALLIATVAQVQSIRANLATQGFGICVGSDGRSARVSSQADNAQSTLPGYRDRIVEVRLRPDEGGINLQMPDAVVRRTAEKGRQAAELLRERFDFDDHRWIRYLTVIGRLQHAVDVMEARWDHELAGGQRGYRQFVLDRTGEHLFARTPGWRSAAVARTAALLSFASRTIDAPDFLENAPQPDPDLRITPRF